MFNVLQYIDWIKTKNWQNNHQQSFLNAKQIFWTSSTTRQHKCSQLQTAIQLEQTNHCKYICNTEKDYLFQYLFMCGEWHNNPFDFIIIPPNEVHPTAFFCICERNDMEIRKTNVMPLREIAFVHQIVNVPATMQSPAVIWLGKPHHNVATWWTWMYVLCTFSLHTKCDI